MSWLIKLFVRKQDAAPVVRHALGQLDAAVADFIIAQVARIPDLTPARETDSWDAADHVSIEGFGHAGNIGKLEIEGFRLTLPPIPPAPPVDNASVAPGCEKFAEAAPTEQEHVD